MVSDGTVGEANEQVGKDPLIGSVVADKYEILSALGEGGMSVVYKARHKMMGKIIAMKLLLPQLVRHEKSVKRFQQEAVAASQLNHPNVISVSDFGCTEGGSPFLVMEYLEGISVSDLIESTGSISVERTLEIMIQACDALRAAHEKNIIHRDLKPSNIMIVSNDRGEDVVKVVDFGIAKLMASEGEEIQKLTQTGELFGSPLYMSPEQCKAEPIDARSDVYSMGCLMYEMLTGKVPLLGKNMLETMYKHINEMPVGLEKNIKNVQLRRQLERVIFRALAKEPDTRYPSMEWMVSDLKVIQQGERQRLFSRIKSVWELVWLKHLPKSQRPVLRAVIILAVLFLAVTVGVASGIKDSLLAPPDVKLPAITWFERVKSERFLGVDNRPTREREMASMLATWRFNTRAVDRAPERSIQAANALAVNYFNQGEFDDAIPVFRREMELRKKHKLGSSFDIADIQIRLGDCFYSLGNYIAARRHYIHGTSLIEDLEDVPRGVADTYIRLGESCEAISHLGEAEIYYGKYIESQVGSQKNRRLSTSSKETYEIAMALSRIADVKRKQSDIVEEPVRVKEAEERITGAEESIDKINAKLQKLQSETIAVNPLVKARALKNQKKALKFQEKKLKAQTKKLSQARQDLETAKLNLKLAPSRVPSRRQAAVRAYEAAKNMWEKLEDYRLNKYVVLYHMAKLQVGLGELGSADKNYQTCMAGLERWLPADHPYIGKAADEYSELLWQEGKWLDSLTRRLQANKIKHEFRRKNRLRKSDEGEKQMEGVTH